MTIVDQGAADERGGFGAVRRFANALGGPRQTGNIGTPDRPVQTGLPVAGD